MAVNPIQLHDNVQEEMSSSKWIFSCKIASRLYSPPPLFSITQRMLALHAAVGLIPYTPFQNPGQKTPWETLPYCRPFTNLKKTVFPLLI